MSLIVQPTSNELIKTAQYEALIDSIKSVNRLPKEALKEAQNLASNRQLLSELFLNEKGLKSLFNNHDTLSNQIALITEEIDDGGLTGFDKEEKRKSLVTLIKMQTDLQKDMKYTPDKGAVQINNNNININSKLDDIDLFRIHRQKRKNEDDIIDVGLGD